MQWLPNVRMLLGRRPWIYWTCVAGLAVAIGSSIHGSQAEVQRARDRWGATVPALMATRAITPGEPLEGAVALRLVPAAVLARTALSVLPAQATARQSIADGELVMRSDVAVVSGPAALLPMDWVGVAVEADDAGMFRVGDSAVVLAGGQTLSPNAVIVGVNEHGVVVGVSAAVAAAVADAANQHTAVVALSASPPPR